MNSTMQGAAQQPTIGQTWGKNIKWPTGYWGGGQDPLSAYYLNSSNPYGQYTGQMGNAFNQMQNQFMKMSPYDGQGGGSANWAYGYPDINNPGTMRDVNTYMGQLLGGTRNLMDQNLRDMAGAGIQRAGLNVPGTGDIYANMVMGQTKALAGDYANRFQQSMDYLKGLYGSQYGAWKDLGSLARGYGQDWLAGLGAQTGWDTGAANALQGLYGQGVSDIKQNTLASQQKIAQDWAAVQQRQQALAAAQQQQNYQNQIMWGQRPEANQFDKNAYINALQKLGLKKPYGGQGGIYPVTG